MLGCLLNTLGYRLRCELRDWRKTNGTLRETAWPWYQKALIAAGNTRYGFLWNCCPLLLRYRRGYGVTPQNPDTLHLVGLGANRISMGEASRDFCFIDNAVQANLLAATTENEDALNQVYNVAVGEQTTLNQLFEMIKGLLAEGRPELAGASAVYRDFRAGDVRHSLADISKAKRLLSYLPSHRISEGMQESMAWYVQDIGK